MTYLENVKIEDIIKNLSENFKFFYTKFLLNKEPYSYSCVSVHYLDCILLLFNVIEDAIKFQPKISSVRYTKQVATPNKLKLNTWEH